MTNACNNCYSLLIVVRSSDGSGHTFYLNDDIAKKMTQTLDVHVGRHRLDCLRFLRWSDFPLCCRLSRCFLCCRRLCCRRFCCLCCCCSLCKFWSRKMYCNVWKKFTNISFLDLQLICFGTFIQHIILFLYHCI